MPFRVAIAGASGYVGGELVRLVYGHPEVKLGALTAGDSAGKRLGDVHRHLSLLADTVIAPTTAEVLADHDVVFLALPHGQSASLAAQLPAETVVIDCGADHRLTDSKAWQTWYGEQLYPGSWPYGLPELPGQREKLAGARRIAVPGCYPTAATLALVPAFIAGLAEPDVVVVAASGTSGAGKAPQPQLTSAEVMGSMTAYGVGGVHRHTPEIVQNLSGLAGRPVTVSFTPMLAPMPRGIVATATASASPGVSAPELPKLLREAYVDIYATEPFIRVLPPGQWPTTAATVGSNTVHVQATYDPHSARIVAVATLDNLVKGAAGAAVQCMNIAMGWSETTALPQLGLAP